MKNLEDEKKRLDTTLKILKQQEDYDGKVEELVKQAERELEQQIEQLLADQEKLKAGLEKAQEEVEDTKARSACRSTWTGVIYRSCRGTHSDLTLCVSGMRTN